MRGKCENPPPFLAPECFQGRVVEGLGYSHVAQAIEWLARETSAEGSGALIVFLGFVKGIVEGGRVKKLLYTAYEPYASRSLDEIAKSFSSRQGVRGLVIVHTSGEAVVGTPTLLVASSCLHRKECYEATVEAVERVKREPPIFKLEVREDGEYWVLWDGRRVKRGERPP